MRLDHDFVRLLMLDIEASDDPMGPSDNELVKLAEKNGKTRDELAYTVDKLFEGGFVKNKTFSVSGMTYIIGPGNLTFQGHEYLDTIRDPKIWKDTKTAASKVASVSLGMMGQIAVAVLTKTLGLN